MPNKNARHRSTGIAAINPEEFEISFLEWVWAINELTLGQGIAIDRTQLRGSAENKLVLGQRKVDEKSNEITAIPELLKRLKNNFAGC